jgi:hypothetical protein
MRNSGWERTAKDSLAVQSIAINLENNAHKLRVGRTERVGRGSITILSFERLKINGTLIEYLGYLSRGQHSRPSRSRQVVERSVVEEK